MKDDPLDDFKRDLLRHRVVLYATFGFLLVIGIAAGLNQVFDLKEKLFPEGSTAATTSTSTPPIVGNGIVSGGVPPTSPSATRPPLAELHLDHSFDSNNRIDGLVWADDSVWVLSRSKLLRYSPEGLLLASHGVELEVFMASRVSVSSLKGLAWDGTGFWTVADVVDFAAGDGGPPSAPTSMTRRLYRFTVDDGGSRVDRWVPAPPHKVSPVIQTDLDWDGSALWYVGETAIYRIDTSSSPPGAVLSQFPIDVAVSGIASEGRDLFVVNYGSCSATIEKVTPPASGAGPKPAAHEVHGQPSALRCLTNVSREDGFLWGAMVEGNDFENGQVVRLKVPS